MLYRRIFKPLLFVFLCFLIANNTNAQTLEDKIDQLLEPLYSANEPGVTALVAKDGEIIYRKAFGMANLELGVEMVPENVFEIGSITKQFTAVSILMLLEQGKLSLEDEITKFIPDYPTNGKTITIHHLLTHTSGIKSYTNMRSFGEVVRKDMTPTEVIDFFKNEPMEFDPGEQYSYNNSGFFILGHIIEQISGEPYSDFIEKNIFEKIGMTSSHYGSHSKVIHNRASGYENRDGFVNTQFISLSLPYAAGSLMSNIDDLLTWQKAITNHTLVKKETIKKAFTNYTLNNGEPINYGYGWAINDLNGTPNLQHGGGIPGYKTMAVYVPSEDVYVAVLSNCGCNSPTDVTVKIAALAIGKPYPEITNVAELSEKELQKWVGAYQFGENTIRFITLEDGQLYSQREGSRKFKILPKSSDHFFFESGLISYTFTMNDGKKEATFIDRNEQAVGIETDKQPEAEKESIKIAADILNQYTGKYELQAEMIIDVTTEGDQIFVQLTGQPTFEIFATSETSFFLKVVVASIDFNKNDKGEVTSLTLHQGGQDMEAKKIE